MQSGVVVNHVSGAGLFAAVGDIDGSDYPTLREALDSPESQHWMTAVSKEVTALKDNGVIVAADVADMPSNTHVLNGHFVNVKKRDADGKVLKYKSRLVVQGNRQRADRGDFDPAHLTSYTFSYSTLLLVLTLAVSGAWYIENSDVDTAFHYSELPEAMYMWLPAQVRDVFGSALVKIVRGLYGLKQSPRLWYDTLWSWLKSLGFSRGDMDPCLFIFRQGAQVLYLLVWVDDFILSVWRRLSS
eukprot:m.292937 g.292937  ORF g.292937 m.292937 type:complete len:243 (-) comp17831_c1_seq1:1699-2427(-)